MKKGKPAGANPDQQSATEPVSLAWKRIAVNGETPAGEVRPEVLRSWKKSREARIDPFGEVSPPLLSGKDLRSLIERNREMIEFCQPMIDMLEISVRDTGFMVSLCDREGHVLLVRGDKQILEMAGHNLYLPGCIRDTKHTGTNAISVCLDEGKPIQITGAEHYNVQFHPWTCSSAPIRDSKGRLLGVITLSGASIGRHKHTLALVTAAAETIETQIRERGLTEEKLRLSSMLNLVFNSISDGVIAVDRNLTITHVNKRATEMLGVEARHATGKSLKGELHPDATLLDAFSKKDYFTGLEIGFTTPLGHKSFMCSVDPIRDSSGRAIGAIISLAEKRQIISIAKRIGGNYAKYSFPDIKGKDPGLLKQIQLARIAARTNSRVLIIGESGTGKELFAQAIHNESGRTSEPFVAISCATIPRDLIEAELFGYRGGAFTGSRREGQVGKFELANRGTLFLDEVNALPLDLQAKLLRVLQQHEILRLGDTRPIPIDVRVLAASNCDLLQEAAQGGFRTDLYYRLNVVEIIIPPLRSRIGDIELLVDHILAKLCREAGVLKRGISKEALEMLKSHLWPGNVRELENCIERAFLIAQGARIDKVHIPETAFKRLAVTSNGSDPLTDTFRKAIESALRDSRGNVSRAAKSLQIARSTLYRKMREFGASTWSATHAGLPSASHPRSR